MRYQPKGKIQALQTPPERSGDGIVQNSLTTFGKCYLFGICRVQANHPTTSWPGPELDQRVKD